MRFVFLLAMLVFAGTAVHAQELKKPARLFSVSNIGVAFPSAQAAAGLGTGTQFASGIEYRLRERTALAGELSFDNYLVSRSGPGYRLSGSAGVMSAVLYFRHRFSSSRLAPFVGVGAGIARLSVPDVTLKADVADIDTKATLSGLFSSEAGARFRISARYELQAAATFQLLGRSELTAQDHVLLPGIRIGFITPL